MGWIHPAVSEICVLQSLDPICGKFDKFLANGQPHMGQMGKWPWQCTTTGLENSTELWMEKICQAVTEIWLPQVWQPPGRPPTRTVTTIPLQPEGLRGKNGLRNDQNVKIINWVSMLIFNELQGPLPVSWIGHTRWIISVKLKLIWLVVTPVQSHMLTDRRMTRAIPYVTTDFRWSYKNCRIKFFESFAT